MGYKDALVSRWTRRDRLAILIVAVAVAFLTGTALLLTAAGAQTAAIATEFESPGSATYHDSLASARQAASGDSVVVPLAHVSTPSGKELVVGLPNGSGSPGGKNAVDLSAPRTTTRGTLSEARTVRLDGTAGTVAPRVTPRSNESSPFPAEWYVTSASTVERLGATGALVIDSTGGAGTAGVPLLSALVFFAQGTRQALRTLGIGTVYAGLLVAVVVYSVTRMLVRDRAATIRVVRATGGTTRTVLALFAIRSGLLTAVGVALGYAIGVVLPRVATNVAVAVGLPLSLTLSVTPSVLRTLAFPFLGLPLVGAVAGALAAWPYARGAPLADREGQSRPRRTLSDGGRETRRARLRAAATPRLLDGRTLFPTIATLSVFVTFVLLLSSFAAAAGPMVASSDATITQPGSEHPVSSRLPEAYASALQERGIAASPEILLFEVHDERPFLARGAQFSAFAAVTNASLVSGTAPTGPQEAAVGADLAETLDLDVGETITLGGSTSPGVTRVHVTGVYTAPGSLDDQLIVSLSTARHLSQVPAGSVNLIRADRLPTGNATGAVEVVDVEARSPAPAGEPVSVNVSVRNYALEKRPANVTVRFAGRSKHIATTVEPSARKTITVPFEASAGTYKVRAGGVTQTVRVVDAQSLVLQGVPARAPPNGTAIAVVETAAGDAVANATVTVGDRRRRTNAAGRVRIPFSESGTRTVVATKGSRRTSATVQVSPDAERRASASVSVSPSSPSMLTRPTATVHLRNPWATPLNGSLTVAGPGESYHRQVRLGPGASRTISVQLPQRPAGEYTVTVREGAGGTLATTNYTVTGDARIASALATGGQSGRTGIGRAVTVAFGNLRVVLATLLVLAGAVAIGGTTATFAQAVHARRRTVGVHRATGANPWAVARLVLVDAARIGATGTLVTTLLSIGVLHVLSAFGFLTVFGVAVSPLPPPSVVLAAGAGGFLVALAGAGLAVAGLLLASPSRLLAADQTT